MGGSGRGVCVYYCTTWGCRYPRAAAEALAVPWEPTVKGDTADVRSLALVMAMAAAAAEAPLAWAILLARARAVETVSG